MTRAPDRWPSDLLKDRTSEGPRWVDTMLLIRAAVPAAAVPAPGLAATGASTDTLLRAALALIAAGATALGTRRHHHNQL